ARHAPGFEDQFLAGPHHFLLSDIKHSLSFSNHSPRVRHLVKAGFLLAFSPVYEGINDIPGPKSQSLRRISYENWFKCTILDKLLTLCEI
ncbi:MAG: hypothetical protein ACAH83_13560, partial [Alphaproteobacteria bacterium]